MEFQNNRHRRSPFASSNNSFQKIDPVLILQPVEKDKLKIVSSKNMSHQKFFLNDISTELLEEPQSKANVKATKRLKFSQTPKLQDYQTYGPQRQKLPSPLSASLQQVKMQSATFINLGEVESQHESFNNKIQLLKMYENLMHQTQEPSKEEQMLHFKVKKFEKDLDKLEQEPYQNVIERAKTLKQFFEQYLDQLIRKKGLSKILQRIVENVIDLLYQQKKQFLDQIQQMDVAFKNQSSSLKEAQEYLKQYKDNELVQEERLKNMFNQYKGLDQEIEEFNQDDEILNVEIPLPPTNAQQEMQERKRVKAHRNLKLLEYDLHNILDSLGKELQTSLESKDPANGLDPKYLNDQMETNIQSRMEDLETRIIVLFKKLLKRNQKPKEEQQIQTEFFDVKIMEDQIAELKKQVIATNKTLKMTRMYLDQSVSNEAKKEEKIGYLQTKIEEMKDLEKQERQKVLQKDDEIGRQAHQIAILTNKNHDMHDQILDLEHHIQSLEQEGRKKDQAMKQRQAVVYYDASRHKNSIRSSDKYEELYDAFKPQKSIKNRNNRGESNDSESLEQDLIDQDHLEEAKFHKSNKTNHQEQQFNKELLPGKKAPNTSQGNQIARKNSQNFKKSKNNLSQRKSTYGGQGKKQQNDTPTSFQRRNTRLFNDEHEFKLGEVRASVNIKVNNVEQQKTNLLTPTLYNKGFVINNPQNMNGNNQDCVSQQQQNFSDMSQLAIRLNSAENQEEFFIPSNISNFDDEAGFQQRRSRISRYSKFTTEMNKFIEDVPIIEESQNSEENKKKVMVNQEIQAHPTVVNKLVQTQLRYNNQIEVVNKPQKSNFYLQQHRDSPVSKQNYGYIQDLLRSQYKQRKSTLRQHHHSQEQSQGLLYLIGRSAY